MAFITKDQVKEIRNKIKAAYPTKAGWKFSVTGGNSSSLHVILKQYPANYSFPEYKQMNRYRMDSADLGDKELRVMEDVMDIITENHWDKSDIMADYFDCAFYYHLYVGEWNEPPVAKVV